uniref:MYND-type domain-containing protein n=2 Tax=Lutzomyia longipalpis TaxID=7200 RepID=A0A1B0CCT8_LUTLO
MKKKVETIKQGTCILTEKPFVHVLKAKYRKERCDHCFSSGKVLKCSGCEYVYYCNRTCQTEAWNLHKIECPYLKKITPRIVPDAARILARIILKLQQGGDLEKGYYTKLCYRKFRDLMSHYHEIRNDPKRLEHLESLSMVLRDLLGEKLVPNFTELQGIYGRGTTLFVRALTDLPALDWSQIFISYVDLMQTPADRRAELKANYYFLCTCSRCIGPQEQLQWKLQHAPAKIAMTDLDVCKICFAKQKNVLHRLNLWHTKTLDLAFESAIEMGKWQDARSFGQLLLPGFRKYNGDFNPLLGLLYMKLGKIELYLEHIAVAREYLLEASKILRVTHGETHSLYAKQLIPLLEQTCE